MEIEPIENEVECCPECGGELVQEKLPRIPQKNKSISSDKKDFVKLQCEFCSFYMMKETSMDKAIRVGALDDTLPNFEEDSDE